MIDADGFTDMTPWIGLVANAHSGYGRTQDSLEALSCSLRAQGFGCLVSWSPNDRSQLVAAANNDPFCKGLIAIGGDGTVSALINEHPSVPIGVLPMGTENLFARYFGMSASPDILSKTITRGKVVWMDLGLTRGRRFTLMAGIGFDAQVITQHHLCRIGANGLPRPTGRLSYVKPVLRASLSYTFPPLRVRILDPGAEHEFEGSTVFLFNLPLYALGLPFAPDAHYDDGLLDLLVFPKPGALQALRYLWLVWRKLHLKSDEVIHRRVRQVEISAASEVPIQLDGDAGGMLFESSLLVEVIPQALAVRIP